MAPYLFPLPTTTLITFSNVVNDPSSSYTSILSEATAARTKLHLALKAVAEEEPGSSAVAVLDAVQVYLPYLRGIVACLEVDELLFKSEPVFPWRSPLTHYYMSSPLLPLLSIHSEYLMVILTHVLALSNHAYAILDSLPKFEPSPGVRGHISTEDEQRTTKGLARAVEILCQASGAAEWAADNVCLQVEPVRTASGGRLGKGKWPAEASRETFKGISMMLLGDAHITAIRKLLLPALPYTFFAPPGPPLPPNHPSASLLAKLYLHVNHLYSSARALLKVHQHGDSTSSGGKKLFRSSSDKDVAEPDSVEGEIIVPLKRYLRKESMLALALGHKWLGVDAGENGKGEKVGVAIAWVKDAQTRLEEMENSAVRDKFKGLGFGKGNEKRKEKEERRARKGRVERELENVKAWVSSYESTNRMVAFQPVPTVSSLVAPSGRPIFAAKPYQPPPSKFEPSRLNRLSDGEEPDERSSPQAPEVEYAGKGNYF